MRPVRDAVWLFSEIRKIRQVASEFTCNFFASPEQAHGWAQGGVLSYVPGDGSLMIFRRDRDFHHLYHAAADSEALGAALEPLKKRDGHGALAADLVGYEEDVRTVAETYGVQGFSRYTSLFRMVRMKGSARHDEYEDGHIAFAEPADAPAILEYMEGLLDRFAEQIPTLEQMHASIARNTVLIVRRGVDLGGLLLFETTGLTTTLRYWLVDGRYRNQGIGSSLIRTLFRLCSSGNRILLWVFRDNDDAIGRYEHYGFHADGLVDQIMIMGEDA